MTDEAKALVKQLLLAKRSYVVGGHTKHEWVNPDGPVAADLIETQAREIERLRERWAMIDQLRGAEGCSVEIIHDNPDPGASNCAIYVTDNFGEDYSTYYGDTVDDCLRHAVEAHAALAEDSHDQ